jgi:hypothetical protein
MPGPLVARTHTLPGGARVLLRVARARDEAPVKALVARTGAQYSELDVARLVRFDPRRRMVVCASELFEGTELVVGFGAIRLDSDRPELVVADERLGEQLDELMSNSLRQLQRARAA